MIGRSMTRPCLLIPILVDRWVLAPVWVLIWPSPNLRTHLEYRHEVEPRIDVITVDAEARQRSRCVEIMRKVADGRPGYIPSDDAEILAANCAVVTAPVALALDHEPLHAVAVAQLGNVQFSSRPFSLDLLDPVSPTTQEPTSSAA